MCNRFVGLLQVVHQYYLGRGKINEIKHRRNKCKIWIFFKEPKRFYMYRRFVFYLWSERELDMWDVIDVNLFLVADVHAASVCKWYKFWNFWFGEKNSYSCFRGENRLFSFILCHLSDNWVFQKSKSASNLNNFINTFQ